MFNASTSHEIERAFAAIAARRPDALLIGTDPFFLNQRDDIVARTAALKLPAIYPFRDYAGSGGLLSFGPNIANSYREAGIYAGRILKGTRPADLPVMQPTVFQLVINLKTARSLGLNPPPTVLAIADEVIE
jgi:putative ABC transport system substrate-binding protein